MKKTKPPEAQEDASDPHVVAVGFSYESDWFRRLPRASYFKTEQSKEKRLPFRIVLDTLLRISPEGIGISCGTEQTCRRRVILFKFFPIWTFGGVYIFGYELGAPVFAHLHELLSFKFSKAEMFFSIFNILHGCFYHLMTSVSFFKDRVFATCE